MDLPYHQSFDEFRSKAREFSLQDEVALLRTMILRVIEGIEQRSETNYANFVGDVYKQTFEVLTQKYKMDEDQADAWSKQFVAVVRPAFSRNIGDISGLTIKEAQGIASLVSKLSKALESWSKVIDNSVATVDINEDLIRFFLQKVVYPVLPVEYRKLIADHARSFSYGSIGGVETEGVPDEEGYLDADFEVAETALVPRGPA